MFRVEVEARGRKHYVDVMAIDSFEANRKALQENSAAISAKVVQETGACEHGVDLSKFCDACRAHLQSAAGKAELVAFAERIGSRIPYDIGLRVPDSVEEP
jgi:hypothetical protein